MLSSRQNFETWQERGSLDTARRANGIWKQLLANYEQPPSDPAVVDALNAYVEKRKIEISRNIN